MKETKNARPSTELEIEKWGVEKEQHSQNIPSTIFVSFSSLVIVSVLNTMAHLSEPPSEYQDSFLLSCHLKYCYLPNQPSPQVKLSALGGKGAAHVNDWSMPDLKGPSKNKTGIGRANPS